MLEILQSYTASAAKGLQSLVLSRETLLFYPSGDSVVIYNAQTLRLIRALAFWEAFPGTRHLKDSIRCLAIDPGMKLLVACLGSRVAAWTQSGTYSQAWRLHSTLLLPEGDTVTALDCKSGLLAVGTLSSLSVYTLIIENDLLTWSPKWKCSAPTPTCIRFSPSLMYMVTTFLHNNVVRVYSTASGRQTQAIPHPRPLVDIAWRRPEANSRDDLILYTTTADGTLRIFMPVLDAPQYIQLHASLDVGSALLSPVPATPSSIFPLDRNVLLSAFETALSDIRSDAEDPSSRRAREIVEEGWDLFLRVLEDGSAVVQAVANIDRRPPTLLKHFILLRSPPGLLGNVQPSELLLLPSADGAQPSLTLVTAGPLASYSLDPLLFFDARVDGPRCTEEAQVEASSSETTADIVRFVRTPEGEGVAALCDDGSGRTWNLAAGHKIRRPSLKKRGSWKADPSEAVDLLVILERGSSFALFTSSSSILTLYCGDTAQSTLSVSPLESLFSLPTMSSDMRLVGVTTSHEIMVLTLHPLAIQSRTTLPFTGDAPIKTIVAVDPMAWSGRLASSASQEPHDALLSISNAGDLAFWTLQESASETTELPPRDCMTKSSNQIKSRPWRCTGTVPTGRTDLLRAACSSARKTVLIASSSEGQELTIWDSNVSEFASGLEYIETFDTSDAIQDLDWTATPDAQSILAIGFAHRVELLCQQRMTYFDDTTGWGRCWTVDIGSILPHPISDSIWLARGSLLVGAGHLMCLFGQPPLSTDDTGEESLFEYVARFNGPLPDYHPQMILQCLLWEKVAVVVRILVNLARNLESGRDPREWEGVPVEDFLKEDQNSQAVSMRRMPQYSVLFNAPEMTEEDEADEFSPSRVKQLIEKLEENPLLHLTSNEHAALLVLIEATLQIQEQRRALDANGLRYIISMRTFYILNRRVSLPSTPASSGNSGYSVRLRARERLRYRDMIWAFHSESQELLLSESVTACGGKMVWADARALGVFIWMHSGESMRNYMETIARNQYMAGDRRDPTECSLFYFALGKSKLVLGLWRQASWHKEQGPMLKFLNNNFNEPRWRTAAQKNAFALLSKRRFEYAAAFFLLSGSLRDAVNVCIKNLSDFQLAIAIARIVEGDDGPVLRDILSNTVLPVAFKDGSRWLASWALWMLNRRDLAVRVLIAPLRTVAAALEVPIEDIGDPHYDDPSLALLFSQLKSKTLQTAKGTSEISGRTEFNFVLQTARVFCRMGCHALALDLVRRWSFQRPSTVSHEVQPMRRPPSPSATRFALEPALRRQSSVFIDMDLTTAPPTRRASPTLEEVNGVSPAPPPAAEKIQDENDFVARKAGLGSLMKSAKKDVQVPDFDMSAFF